MITMEENLEDGPLKLFLTFLHTSPLHKPLPAFLKDKQGFMLVLVKKQISKLYVVKRKCTTGTSIKFGVLV